MTEMVEIEFKTLLTKEDYMRLLSHYQLTADRFHSQTNFYYDTPDFQLKQNGCGLRIRVLDNYAEYTLKTPAIEGKLETTDSYTVQEATKMIEEHRLPRTGAVFQKLQEFSIDSSQLINIGHLTTKRAEFPIEEGLLAIDESWGEQLHDYELELEVTDAKSGKKAFEHFLQRQSIPYHPSKNKIQRMFEAKN
ncbi:CYTH domain-containing protein [Candidatus Enterococcus mangumiae]|uniref:CYTH domain-containing protein n=1 Tax=Candidatus Enterococcus mangumiae TaxID=2230878 RepID=A0ABZ2STY1_9ENTE|nr:CYTH domain-containing protein [Enterococcus sp. DIV1094]MBO0489383.1 CYTH domain-containing protein [Enterococcus sp. DIV1094]